MCVLIGDNGFRWVAIRTLQEYCNFVGKDFETIQKYFGPPNKTITGDSAKYYQYTLTNFDKWQMSDLYLELKVNEKGIVVDSNVHRVIL